MRKLILMITAAALLLACPAVCLAAGDEPVFTDDLGQEVTAAAPQRVAALTGSFADIWCLAGGHDSLVATAHDTWTSFDLDLDSTVADLGAITSPSLETLLAAQPDLVLASCNTDADLALADTLAQAGIPTAYFDIQCLDDYLRMLDICTQLTGHTENYALYGTAVRQQADQAIARQDGSAPTVLCVRATSAGCKIKGSRDYLLGEMLADLGCVNVADGSSLLEELSLEQIILRDPDYIFAVVQGSDPTDAQAVLDAALLSNPAWDQLRAVREGRFYTLDQALYNLKPNARWGQAYEELADILYPAEQ